MSFNTICDATQVGSLPLPSCVAGPCNRLRCHSLGSTFGAISYRQLMYCMSLSNVQHRFLLNLTAECVLRW